MRELLWFKYIELPRLEKRLRAAQNKHGVRLCGLFRLFIGMALQGRSLCPRNPAHLAKRVQFMLTSAPAEAALVEPLLDLLISEPAKPETGVNFEEASDLARVIESEHQRREGVAEQGWKARDKFDLHRQEVIESPRFKHDWDSMKRHFDIQKFRDSRGIIRRSPLAERNWQRPTQVALDVTRDRFQVAFDFFCWKWFLYGMTWGGGRTAGRKADVHPHALRHPSIHSGILEPRLRAGHQLGRGVQTASGEGNSKAGSEADQQPERTGSAANQTGSLKESMDEFRFRELAEHMEKRDFASLVRAETV